MKTSVAARKKGRGDRRRASRALVDLLTEAFQKDVQILRLDLIERMLTEHEESLTEEDKSELARFAFGDEPIPPQEIKALARPKLKKLLSSKRDQKLRSDALQRHVARCG